MTRPLEASIVSASGTIRDAMEALDAGARQIALAVDADRRLVGVATDGNIRRALLNGASPDDPLEPALTRADTIALEGALRRANAAAVRLQTKAGWLPDVDVVLLALERIEATARRAEAPPGSRREP